jgi:hypothetical protein
MYIISILISSSSSILQMIRVSSGSNHTNSVFTSRLVRGLLVLIFLVSGPSIVATAAQQGGPGSVILNGGPGQALAFYGTQSAAVFPLDLSEELAASFTLEFWVSSRCASPACAFFTLQTAESYDFAYVHRDSLYCFGQRFVLTDGQVPGLLAPVPWPLYNYSASWNHLAFMANRESGECQLYLNGGLFVAATVAQPPPAGPIFSATSRLILGQLARSGRPIPDYYAFRGYIDEIRLWRGPRFPGVGYKQMMRGLMPIERDANLISYWNMDTEPMLTHDGPVGEVQDVHVDGRTGYLMKVGSIFDNPASTEPCTATFAPSYAPIVTREGAWVVHINATSTLYHRLRYICLDEYGNTMLCPPNVTKYISTFPSAGQLYAANVTTQQQYPLYAGSNTTQLGMLAYEPIEFLLIANGGVDSFRWFTVGGQNNGSIVNLYAPTTTAYSTLNSSLGVVPKPIRTTSKVQTVISLGCGSELGDVTYPVLVAPPSMGQLYQLTAKSPLGSNNGSLTFVPTHQITPCVDPSAPDLGCIVSHFSGSVIYQPIISTNSHDLELLNLTLTYACVSYPLVGTSAHQTINLHWSPGQESNQVAYVPSMIGPNPYALLFDGELTSLKAEVSQSRTVKAVSLWVRPELNPQYDAQAGSYLEKRILVQMFPRNDSTDHSFELSLMRNASSYPQYFVSISNYNWDPEYGVIGLTVVSTYNTSGSSAIEPNQWTNIMLTFYSSVEKRVGLYLNGSPIISTLIGAISAPQIIHLGGSDTSSGTGVSLSSPSSIFFGMLDDFSLWNAPIEAVDILRLQDEEIRPSQTGLMAHWQFHEGFGFNTTDAKNGWVFSPTSFEPAMMPLWVFPGEDLTFSALETSLTAPQVIQLKTHSTPTTETWKMGTYLTQLPVKGTLYQLPANFSSSNFRRDPNLINTLVRIEGPFVDDSEVPRPALIRQWVSSVLGCSSSREAPVGTNYWAPEQLIGAPSWWSSSASSDAFVSGMQPVYGESVNSWCPQSECVGGNNDTEWVNVSFERAVYLQRVEVFQNLRPGAVTKILAWDDFAQTWRPIYESEPMLMSNDYATLIPSFCAQTTFATNMLRVELNPCHQPGWHEIEAIRLTGTTQLPAGVVSNPLGQVLYVPDAKTPGPDRLTYTASECPFTLPTASPYFTYQLLLGSTSTTPLAYSNTVDVLARELTKIQLGAYSADSSPTTFQRIISRFPSEGTLFDAIVNDHGELAPGSSLVEPGPVLLSNPDGYVFYRAPSICKYDMASFDYYVSAQGQLSSTATITLNSLCKPSFLNYRRWLAIVLLIITLVAIGSAVAFGAFVIVKRKWKPVEEDRPAILFTIAFGAVIAYASLLFEFAPITPAWCLARMWVLHLGTVIVVAGALAFTLMKWNDFSVQALRSGSSGEIPLSVIVLPLFSICVEVILLIVFSAINKPVPKLSLSPNNSAIQVASCIQPKFSNLFLLINKAVWIFAVFIISAILLSVSLTILRAAVVMICASLFAVICGIIFVVSIASISDPDILLLLKVLALIIPLSAFLAMLSIGKILSKGSHKQAVVETSEFGLQPISAPPKGTSRSKSSTHLSETVANVQMTKSMNNHTVDKSVNNLLDTIQDKEREIAMLKRKLLKRHYRIRELQQKLSDTVEGSQMMYSQAAPSDFGD